MNKKEIKKFYELNNKRKKFYWIVKSVEDKELQKELYNNFRKLKKVFEKYKLDKNLINEKNNKMLENYLDKFISYLKTKKVI